MAMQGMEPLDTSNHGPEGELVDETLDRARFGSFSLSQPSAIIRLLDEPAESGTG